MGYDELMRDLLREAESRAEGIVSLAREEARRAIAAALEQAEQSTGRFEENESREAERARRIQMNRVRGEERAIRMAAEAALADKVFALLEKRLRVLGSKADYAALFGRLFEEMRPDLPEADLIVYADEKVRPRLKERLRGREVRFEPLPEEEWGGVEVSDAARSVRIRNTFRGRLAKSRPQLLVEIHKWMSGHD
ncbi:MAG TPA: V-type ATP synthase subunit E [Nitrospiria bacterium]